MILREIKNMYVPKIQQIEYLESTGTQYIDTEFKHNNNTRFVTLLSFQSVSEWSYPFGAFGDSNKRSIFALESDYEERIYSYYGYIYSKKSFNQKVKLNYLYNIDFNKNTHTINDTSIVHDTSNFSSIYNTFIFASSTYDDRPISNNKVRCYYFQIYDNGTLVRDFIPVRIGTKGYMLDKVSGELYGNSGTGDFVLGQDVGYIDYSKNLQQIYQNKLIEGVDYETADWLKGDAVAYINTNYLLDFDDIKTSIFRSYNTANQVFEGSRYEPQPTTNNGAGTVIGYARGSNYSSFFSPNGLMSHWNRTIPINVESTVVMSKNGITLNGTNISSVDQVTPIVGSRFDSVTPYLIFASWIHNWQIDNRRQKVDYKSFEIEGKLHLVPCKLLRSIPRNLDAQCKERVAGECGMIDLNSGKFYGNVASSGTFTVENDNNE